MSAPSTDNILYDVSTQYGKYSEETLESPSDLGLYQFKYSDRKKVHYHATKAGLKINGFRKGNSFVVVIFPDVDISDSPFIRDEFTPRLHEFLKGVYKFARPEFRAVYKRIDLYNYKLNKRIGSIL